MSNNIYDILKKMQNLESPKQSLTESKKAKPDYIDIDKDGDKKEPMKKAAREKSKGAVAEAVAYVEQQLSEKYMGFKKTVAAIKKGGSAENPEAVAAAIGRKKYGKTKFQKAAAAGKKLGEGAVEESGLQAYLGKKKYGETGMKALQQAGRDGASKEKMARIRAQHDKMDEAVGQEGPADLLAAVEQEINNPGRSIDNLLDVLNATFGSDRSPEFKKARAVIGKYLDLVDNASVGSEQDGIAPMRGGNIARHIQQYDLTDYLQHAAAMLDKAVKGPMDEGNQLPSPPDEVHLPKKGSKHGPVDVYKKPKNEDMLSAKQKEFAALAEPKDKITYADKIAGAKKKQKDEGNEFSGELVKARAQGKDSFEVDGKEYQVKEGRKSMREGWEEMQKYLEKKKGPQSKGGEGKKAGTRYGGSAQKDDDDDTDGEGQPVVKKKGRPKGTGGGAKFSFKKPKD